MKTKSRSRFAAVFLALAMLLSSVSFSAFTIGKKASAAAGGTYTLVGDDLMTKHASEATKDSKNHDLVTLSVDSEKAGTGDYFTLHYKKINRKLIIQKRISTRKMHLNTE